MTTAAPKLQDLVARREELDRQIEQLRQQQRGDVIRHIRELMEQFSLSVDDLRKKRKPRSDIGKPRGKRSPAKKVAAKAARKAA